MESLQQGWPEPVVPVQALSDSGLVTVPDKYVKPPSERPSSEAAIFGSSATPNIPVIDLGGLAGDADECRATIRALAEACREWGFFQAVNHGVRPELVARAREVWRGFFELPTAEKQAYTNDPETYEGYGSRLGVEKGAILDWGDYFFLNLLPQSLKNPSRWPALPTSLRETVEEYEKEMTRLCGMLMRVLSMSLGLDVDRLSTAFGGDDIGATFRANYYPKCPQPELALGLSAHSDPGGLTIVLADESVKGLQVRRDESWVTVHPLPDAFIVNIGDQIQILTNGIYKSVEHRVAVNAVQERISLVFFYNPKSDVPIAPISELVEADQMVSGNNDNCNVVLYRPMTYSEYRLFIRSKGPKGKTQLLSLDPDPNI